MKFKSSKSFFVMTLGAVAATSCPSLLSEANAFQALSVSEKDSIAQRENVYAFRTLKDRELKDSSYIKQTIESAPSEDEGSKPNDLEPELSETEVEQPTGEGSFFVIEEGETEFLGDGIRVLEDGTVVFPDGARITPDGEQVLPNGDALEPQS